MQSQQLSSDVTALPTAQLVQRDLTAIRSPRAQACFEHFLDQMVVSSAGGSVQFGQAQIAPLAADAPGMGGSFGYRVTITGSAGTAGPQVTIYADVLGFARKNYEIDLNAIAAGQPIPTATEQHLFSLLATRAGTAIH